MRPPPGDERLLAWWAAHNHAVLTTAQARGLGFSDHQVWRRVRSGHLHRMHRGVYAIGHPVLTRRGTWLAGVRACDPGPGLAHRSAGALLGFIPDDFRPVEVVVPGASRIRRDGLVIHRTRRPPQLIVVDAIPVTTPTRTLLDLAEVLTPGQLRRAVAKAGELGRLDVPRPAATLAVAGGRRGAATLSLVLAEEIPPTRSELEDRFLALLDERGLPRPLVNVVIEGVEVDCHWPARRLIVELDGRAFHLSAEQFETDRARDAHLTVRGWSVVRFTWRQIVRAPAGVGKTLAALLEDPLRAAAVAPDAQPDDSRAIALGTPTP